MKERPILFSGPMVRALLAGRKTQTRRVVKPQPISNGFRDQESFSCHSDYLPPDAMLLRAGSKANPYYATEDEWPALCPYGAPGDRLWVKETHAVNVPGCERGLSYRADHQDLAGDGPANPMRWIPSIHMRRAYSRLTLEVTDVRVERAQDISEVDAIAEGCPIENPMPFVKGYGAASASGWFSDLWEQINGEGSWAANPYVWCISFKVVT